VSNEAMESNLQMNQNRAAVSGGGRSLVCTKCGASKVARSRLQRFDDLTMRFIAKSPYRCLHCYHRFWVREKIGDSRKRAWTLSLLALFLVLLALKLLGVFDSSAPSATVSIIVPESDPSAIDDDSPPSLASLINLPNDALRPETSVDVKNVSSAPQVLDQTPEELLTSEQRAQRLVLAKQEAEAAEQRSQARVEQLEQVLLPAKDELESLIKVEVGYVVERWREAWSNGDVENYLLSYSSDFKPSNELTIDAWKANRRYRVKPEKNISVELSDFDIAMLEELNSGVVEFNQRYQSGSYIENSRKRLSLAKQDGTWKITSEVELK